MDAVFETASFNRRCAGTLGDRWQTEQGVDFMTTPNTDRVGMPSPCRPPQGLSYCFGSALLLFACTALGYGREIVTLEGDKLAKGQVEHLAFSPNGKILAIACSEGITICDVESGKRLPITFEGLQGNFHGLTFSADGKLLVASTGPLTYVLDVATGKKKHTFKPAEGEYLSMIAVSPDNKTLAIGGVSHAATLFDLETFKELAKLEDQKEIVDLAFDKTGERLATASKHGRIIIWDVKKREKLKTLDQSENSAIFHMAFSADGKTVINNGSFKSNALLRVWDVEKGEPRGTYGGRKPKTGEYGQFGYLALTPDAKTLYFTCGTLLAMIADIEGGSAPEPAPGFKPGSTIQAITLSPDGKLLAVAAGNEVKIVDAPKKKKE
jgi:WD40 repeat protein